LAVVGPVHVWIWKHEADEMNDLWDDDRNGSKLLYLSRVTCSRSQPLTNKRYILFMVGREKWIQDKDNTGETISGAWVHQLNVYLRL
jgi:hypothetical protein